MISGCNLRNNSAIRAVEIGLTEDNTGTHFAPIGYDCGGSFIAGGLNAKHIHGFFAVIKFRVQGSGLLKSDELLMFSTVNREPARNASHSDAGGR